MGVLFGELARADPFLDEVGERLGQACPRFEADLIDLGVHRLGDHGIGQALTAQRTVDERRHGVTDPIGRAATGFSGDGAHDIELTYTHRPQHLREQRRLGRKVPVDRTGGYVRHRGDHCHLRGREPLLGHHDPGGLDDSPSGVGQPGSDPGTRTGRRFIAAQRTR